MATAFLKFAVRLDTKTWKFSDFENRKEYTIPLCSVPNKIPFFLQNN